MSTSRTEMRPNGSDRYAPIPRAKRLDERSFYESKSKLSLSLDMLDIKGPEFPFELVPVCLGYALIRPFHSLSLPGSLLVGARRFVAVEKFSVPHCGAIRRVTH